MDTSLMSTTELNDSEESLGCLNEHVKTDIPIVGILPTSTAPYSLPQNCLGIVLVDTSSQNLQMSLGADLNNSAYSGPPVFPGRQFLQSTIAIPGIFQQVPNSEVEDEQANSVYNGEHDDDVCNDSLGGTHIVQGNILSETANLEEDLSNSTNLDEDLSNSENLQEDLTNVETNQKNVQKRKSGWPKGKRRKYVPEIIPPKAPPTGYVAFSMERRAEIKRSHPRIPFYEVTKLLGQEWTDLDPEKKQKYLDEADEAKKKYYEELKIFRESDAYKNLLKKRRKIGENGSTDPKNDKSNIENEMTCLYCEICDVCFTSAHNKKEHMLGKFHLQNVSAEIHKQEKEKQKEQMNISLEDSDNEHSVSDGPVHIEGFINSFRAQNHEREQEICRLRSIVKSARRENSALYKELEDLKLYENRLTAEVEASKQYSQNIISQTETLKIICSMFGAMFGVINFEV